jgi:metallothionein
MTTETTTCACKGCNCTVNLSTGLQKDDQYYCCEACANGHASGQTCGCSGCGCG